MLIAMHQQQRQKQTEQHRAEQSRTEQSRAEQSRAAHHITSHTHTVIGKSAAHREEEEDMSVSVSMRT